MNEINAIIIDDELGCVATLSLLIKKYHPDVRILDTANSMESGLKAIEKHRHQIDILFLDIQMQGNDGFTLLQHIPDIFFNIIFTTAFDQFAIQAIKFSALDYLLKPIDNKELNIALEKFRKNKKNLLLQKPLNDFKKALEQNKVFEKLAVPTIHDVKFIDIKQILFLESDVNYTTIHLENNQKIVSSKNIGYYEDLLDPEQFFRLHNSYIVNIKRIERYIRGRNGSVELGNGKILEVSSRRKESLRRLLGI